MGWEARAAGLWAVLRLGGWAGIVAQARSLMAAGLVPGEGSATQEGGQTAPAPVPRSKARPRAPVPPAATGQVPWPRAAVVLGPGQALGRQTVALVRWHRAKALASRAWGMGWGPLGRQAVALVRWHRAKALASRAWGKGRGPLGQQAVALVRWCWAKALALRVWGRGPGPLGCGWVAEGCQAAGLGTAQHGCGSSFPWQKSSWTVRVW